MAAYRYWRIWLTNRNPGGVHRILLSDVKMRETAGGPDLAAAGTFTATLTDSASDPARLNDGNLSTWWVTQFFSGIDLAIYITADLGSPKTIDQIELTGNSLTGSGILYLPKEAIVIASTDGVTFDFLRATDLGAMVPDVAFVLSDIQTNGPNPATMNGPPSRLDTTWPTGVGSMKPLPILYDLYDGGPMAIEGHVYIDDDPDIPVSRKVRLFDYATGRLVRETWSDVSGFYSFTELREGKYFVVSHDHTLNDNAAIRDYVDAEVPA